jgi:hypothetical protein
MGVAKPTMVEMDHASPHRSKETLIYVKDFNCRPAPHQAFSTELARPCFYRYGTIKGRLIGRSFRDAAEPMADVKDVNSFIRPSELNAVFRNSED